LQQAEHGTPVKVVIRKMGIKVNHKRVYRLYCLEGLTLRASGLDAGKARPTDSVKMRLLLSMSAGPWISCPMLSLMGAASSC